MATLPQALLIVLAIYLSLFSTNSFAVELTESDLTHEASLEAKGSSIIIMGASYAKGWQIKELSCLNVINKGISGEQSFETLERFGADAIQPRPVAILIWGFINDLHRNPKENIESNKQRVKDSISTMVETSLSHGIIPILATEVTLGISKSLKWKIMSFIGELRGKQSYQDFINTNVLDINQFIRQLAMDKNLILLDIEKVMTNKDGERKDGYAQSDGSHLTEYAYSQLSAYALPVLNRELISFKAVCN
jgi:lysophospholipase L1-like esterase